MILLLQKKAQEVLEKLKMLFFADLGLRNFFTIIKYAVIILIILPWIIQINTKVKQNGVLPRLQDFFLETFTYHEIVFNSSNCNCTVDKRKNPSSL